MDILYGRNPVVEALRSGRPARKIVVATGLERDARLREILDLAGRRGIAVEESPRRRLDDIAHSEHHQGVAGYFHARSQPGLDELIESARQPALLLVLDGIQDPHNLGALTRTAEGAGADGLVIPRHGAAPVTAAAVKAAAGATEHLPVVTVANISASLQRMADAGIWRVGLDAAGTTRYDQFDYTVPVALVVGAEGEGMRALTKRHCDALVSLPMAGRISSLNAAAAGAVLLYEVARQRGFPPRAS